MAPRRNPDEARKKYESRLLNKQSKAAHEQDLKNNTEPLGFRPNRREDSRSAKSRAFERRWLGS